MLCTCCRQELLNEREGDREDQEVKKDMDFSPPAAAAVPWDSAADTAAAAPAAVVQHAKAGQVEGDRGQEVLEPKSATTEPKVLKKKVSNLPAGPTPEEKAAKEASRLQQKGDAAFENQQWDVAMQAYTEAIASSASAAGAWRGRGGVRLRNGDHAGAVADLNEALRLEPDNLFALRDRAEARLRTGDHEGALADYDRKLALAPGDGRALCGRGEARLLCGDREGALCDFNLAVRLTYPGAAELLKKAKAAR